MLYHHHEGGTGVTNFSADHLPQYQETIKLFNSEEVWIESPGIENLCNYALCCTNYIFKNRMPEFWKLFGSLEGKIITKGL
jgi:hypothetical protein